ncbi:hypothetical protein MADP07_00691 [Mycoplasma anatis]|uniref:Uncharacterized protein n=1 Tax=Mycoplasmopsis anatis TaxID=171279 RepID=A0A9Q3LAB1_9BACT|nr:hypothetical protein [Mycoplasmopsis anatis]MBW0602951.1 hypothetical protein [Mycoplasmopsis anatis]MBW0604369.1 hypothetical protein [Mycoplasmopsis anatis]
MNFLIATFIFALIVVISLVYRFLIYNALIQNSKELNSNLPYTSVKYAKKVLDKKNQLIQFEFNQNYFTFELDNRKKIIRFNESIIGDYSVYSLTMSYLQCYKFMLTKKWMNIVQYVIKLLFPIIWISIFVLLFFQFWIISAILFISILLIALLSFGIFYKTRRLINDSVMEQLKYVLAENDFKIASRLLRRNYFTEINLILFSVVEPVRDLIVLFNKWGK